MDTIESAKEAIKRTLVNAACELVTDRVVANMLAGGEFIYDELDAALWAHYPDGSAKAVFWKFYNTMPATIPADVDEFYRATIEAAAELLDMTVSELVRAFDIRPPSDLLREEFLQASLGEYESLHSLKVGVFADTPALANKKVQTHGLIVVVGGALPELLPQIARRQCAEKEIAEEASFRLDEIG